MKNKLLKPAILLAISLLILVFVSILADKKIIAATPTIILTTICMISTFVSAFFLSKAEHEISTFECKHCGHSFKPTTKEFITSAHTSNSRYLKCPKCEKKSWCRREFDYED